MILGAGTPRLWYSQQPGYAAPPGTGEFSVSPSPVVWPQEVQSIATLFDCPCGNCDLNLADCTCDNAKGALEIKGYISTLLKTDSREDVIKQVEAKYGPRN